MIIEESEERKMKGYKAFNRDLTCRNYKYEIGKVFELDGKPEVCKRGFHFCTSISDCYRYYSMSDKTRICEVEALGEVDTNDNVKYATNKIKILSEITDEKIKKCNSGSYNSGYRNSGNCNSGSYNSGYRNSGSYNLGNYNSGLFNTDYNPKIKIFDKESEWTYTDWSNSDAKLIIKTCPSTYLDFVSEKNMTDEEKAIHPEYKINGGYVKLFFATSDDKKKWWDELSDEDKNVIKSIPNFDWNKFVKCIGME